MNNNGLGFTNRLLTIQEISSVCEDAVSKWDIKGKRVLIIIPDGTRTCPMDLIFRLLYKNLVPHVQYLNILVALGTHPPMTDDEIYKRVGITREEHSTKYPKVAFFNHLWNNPKELIEVGRFTKKDVAEITGGLFEMEVGITCNKIVADHDIAIIVGPVFPHEVVGFSGGNKYLFPGIAGQEIIDFFHWLGAVITNPEIIGNKYTSVRKVVNKAASLLSIDRKALCMVVKGHDLAGLYYGTAEESWSAAADLSAQLHIKYTGRYFHTVLSCAPEMYDDLWTGGKCMYKVEPVVADGGRVIIYAPHINDVSIVHGEVLKKIGYHTRDFFLKQWDKYKHYPWGVVAHSTHVKGVGSYKNGVETPRVEVVLATGIPEDICRKVNLGYMDYRSINKNDFEGKEEEGILYIPKAGEILYKV